MGRRTKWSKSILISVIASTAELYNKNLANSCSYNIRCIVSVVVWHRRGTMTPAWGKAYIIVIYTDKNYLRNFREISWGLAAMNFLEGLEFDPIPLSLALLRRCYHLIIISFIFHRALTRETTDCLDAVWEIEFLML